MRVGIFKVRKYLKLGYRNWEDDYAFGSVSQLSIVLLAKKISTVGQNKEQVNQRNGHSRSKQVKQLCLVHGMLFVFEILKTPKQAKACLEKFRIHVSACVSGDMVVVESAYKIFDQSKATQLRGIVGRRQGQIKGRNLIGYK